MAFLLVLAVVFLGLVMLGIYVDDDDDTGGCV